MCICGVETLHAMSYPSRQANAGCTPPLRRDVACNVLVISKHAIEDVYPCCLVTLHAPNVVYPCCLEMLQATSLPYIPGRPWIRRLKQADAHIPAEPADGIGTHAGRAVAGCGNVSFEAGLKGGLFGVVDGVCRASVDRYVLM